MVSRNKRRVNTRQFVRVIILSIIIVIIKVITYFPGWIEHNYSTFFYPFLAKVFRTISGIIPFSIGDIIYFGAGIILLIKGYKLIVRLFKRQITRLHLISKLVKLFVLCSIVYIVFNLAWGLNYNRLGIAYQLKLKEKEHEVEDLKAITHLLLLKLNRDRAALGPSQIKYPHYKIIFNKALQAYQNCQLQYPFLRYEKPSVKRSLYGRAGNYLGFLGYYNPFTGEAQLNLTQPRFLIPFVTCHEIAHQLGYASESEANFVGYLAAVKSPDTLFHYSAYFDLFNYANRELYKKDSLAAKENYKQLDTLVKQDVLELKTYLAKSENFIEPFIRIFYDQYLKANQQDKGIKSYNDVVAWLIEYNKKYGSI